MPNIIFVIFIGKTGQLTICNHFVRDIKQLRTPWSHSSFNKPTDAFVLMLLKSKLKMSNLNGKLHGKRTDEKEQIFCMYENNPHIMPYQKNYFF